MNTIKHKLLAVALLCSLNAENSLNNKNNKNESEKDLLLVSKNNTDQPVSVNTNKKAAPKKKKAVKKELNLIQKIVAKCFNSFHHIESNARSKADLEYARDLFEDVEAEFKVSVKGKNELLFKMDLGNLAKVTSNRVFFDEFECKRIASISKKFLDCIKHMIEYVFIVSKINLAKSHNHFEYLPEFESEKMIVKSLLKMYKDVNFEELDQIAIELVSKPSFEVETSTDNIIAPGVSKFDPFWSFMKILKLKLQFVAKPEEQKDPVTGKNNVKSDLELAVTLSPARMFGSKKEDSKFPSKTFKDHINDTVKIARDCRKAFFSAQRKMKLLESVDIKSNQYVEGQLELLDKMMDFYLNYAELIHKNGRLLEEVSFN